MGGEGESKQVAGGRWQVLRGCGAQEETWEAAQTRLVALAKANSEAQVSPPLPFTAPNAPRAAS